MAADPLRAIRRNIRQLRMTVPPMPVGAPGSSGSPGTAVLFGPGSAAAPSMTFSGDPDTGLYNPAANTLGIALGGVLAWSFVAGTTTYSRAGGGNIVNLTGENSSGYQAFVYATGNNPLNVFARGRGTIASPLAPAANDSFGVQRFRGYAPTPAALQTSAEWRVVNREASFDNTAAGSYTALFHCKLGTVTLSETVRFDSDNGISMGGANPVIDANRLFIRRSFTVATLPAAPAVGAAAFVTDATATTFASTVVGGGSNKVPVYYDGAWKIG